MIVASGTVPSVGTASPAALAARPTASDQPVIVTPPSVPTTYWNFAPTSLPSSSPTGSRLPSGSRPSVSKEGRPGSLATTRVICASITAPWGPTSVTRAIQEKPTCAVASASGVRTAA